jgi:hypothetical protein
VGSIHLIASVRMGALCARTNGRISSPPDFLSVFSYFTFSPAIFLSSSEFRAVSESIMEYLMFGGQQQN